MTCSGEKILAHRNADKRVTYTPRGRNFSFAALNPTFTVRRGATVLLQVTGTATPNGSVFSNVDDAIVLTLEKADLALLDSVSPDTDDEILSYDIVLTDGSGFENWMLGGPFVLLGLNNTGSCDSCGDVEVSINGDCVEISVEGGNIGVGASVLLADLNQAVEDAEASADAAAASLAAVPGLAASAGAAAGAAVFNGNTTAYSRTLLTAASQSAFLQASGAQSQVFVDPTDPRWGAVGNGIADDTAALQAAQNYAGPLGLPVLISGNKTFLVSNTLLVASGPGFDSRGETYGRIKKTTNWSGPMIQYGTSSSAYQGGGCKNGYWAYHDYGNGPFPPNDISQVSNPSNSQPLVEIFGPNNAVFVGLRSNGGAQSILLRGGAQSTFVNCTTYGVWDPTKPPGASNAPGTYGLQFSQAGLKIVKGPNGELPTGIRFIGCTFAGQITATNVSITWPDPGGTGPYVTTDVVRNIGPKRAVEITCAEGVSFVGCYFGSGSFHNLAFNNVGDILSNVSTTCSFMDAAHEEMVAFEGSGTTTQITLDMSEWVGQNNGFGALTDKNYTGGGYSVIGLDVSGGMRAFIGPPVRLLSARRWTITSDIRWFNTKGFYTSLSGYNCGIHAGANVRGGVVRSQIGGDNAGVLDTKTVVGVNIVSGGIVDTSGAVANGLSGALVVGGFKNTAIRVEDANFTLTQRVDACFIEHLGTLTANRTITLSSTGARDGDTWSVTRGGGGAFTLSVVGADTIVLNTNQYAMFRYNSDASRIYHVSSGTRL